ncbi:hypothetical protein ACFYSJ_14920 [Streptomyces sp. NPDC005248]|uniref:hypothetical protein n=1 Tax=Streptomyces sp. NPDC005248 TaxID=3364709 RepID=UPI00369E0DAE
MIKAWDDNATESVASPTITVTTLARDLTPPAAVTGLTAEATEYGIELHWNANTEPDLKRYVVYVGELIDSEDERVCYGVSSVYLGAGTTSYTDERLPDGEERCYFVDVEDTSGNSSFRATHDAEIAVVTERDLTPSVETPDSASLTLTALKGATGTSVDLSWNTVADATGYLVERWNPATDAYEQLTTGPVTEVSYTDATAPAGTTHFYRVTPVLGDGTEAAPAAAWVILAPVK